MPVMLLLMLLEGAPIDAPPDPVPVPRVSSLTIGTTRITLILPAGTAKRNDL